MGFQRCGYLRCCFGEVFDVLVVQLGLGFEELTVRLFFEGCVFVWGELADPWDLDEGGVVGVCGGFHGVSYWWNNLSSACSGANSENANPNWAGFINGPVGVVVSRRAGWNVNVNGPD